MDDPNTASKPETLVACPECDLVLRVSAPDKGQWVRCPRCRHPLVRPPEDRHLTPALAVTALVMLAVALSFPYIEFQRSGIGESMTVLDAATKLAAFHHPELGLLVFGTIVVLPALYLLAVLWIEFSLGQRPRLPGTRTLIRALHYCKPWMMADVFAIAALVSLVKIIGMAEVFLKPGFWTFAGFALFLLMVVQRVNPLVLWTRLEGPPQAPPALRPGLSARLQHYQGCEQCSQLQPIEHQHCDRCSARLHSRYPDSIQRTLAYLVAATIACFPAHLYPIMVTTSLGNTQPATIISGVLQFIAHGDWPIALVIFTASVVVPFGKILALGWLCLASRREKPLDMPAQMALYRFTEWIGRWSMIDVFVVAIVVALVRLGNLMSIDPGPGGMAFAAVVILTMLAAHSFDPRLIWDQQQRRTDDYDTLERRA